MQIENTLNTHLYALKIHQVAYWQINGKDTDSKYGFFDATAYPYRPTFVIV